MAKENMTRREFMHQVGIYGTAGLAVLGAGVLLTGCGGEEKAAEMGAQPKKTLDTVKAAVDPCGDVSGLAPAEIQTRETFEYVSFEENAEERCTTCHFWTPPAGDSPCGTCTLVKGPINPNGGCMSWQAKEEA